jgi:uncharacterized UPF0160 family protein
VNWNPFKKKVIVATHDGSYHADDVMATAILTLWLERKNIPYNVIRTRHDDELLLGDYVFDIGGIYDHTQKRYDHHQPGGAGQRPNGVPYASAGLVWKHYGIDLCEGDARVAEEVDWYLIQSIDAPDNGYTTFTIPNQSHPFPFTITELFSVFLPSNEESFSRQSAFDEIVPIARRVLERVIKREHAFVSLVRYIEESYQSAHDKRLVILERQFSRQEVQAAIGSANVPEALFFVFASEPQASLEGHWRVLTVRKDRVSFVQRKPLPATWAGLTGKALATVSGVPDAIFCHRSLFMAVAGSREGALKLAEIALSL